ncbi:MAG: DUF3800 domain-containing protein [Schleiferiaceae bacterium]|nr:DUF3800 domain-containing protein [Schleiferiaceae bacterium]MDR9442654.1 DUF3800 domain-containing protein [Schleiferiaceae bacterium]
MQIMYVDESGDPGRIGHTSPHYILSGLIVDQNNWLEHLNRLKTFRAHLKKEYGLNQRTEIHASELIRIRNIDSYRTFTKQQRISILKLYVKQIPIIFSSSKILNISINKEDFPKDVNVQELAWKRLLQRYNTYLTKTANDKGMIISDDTDGNKVVRLMRKMRVYNPTPSHFSDFYNAPTDNIIEDLVERSSQESYFIQSVDVIVHLLYRHDWPKGSLKKFGLEKDFLKLTPLLLRQASKTDQNGIVRK